MLLGDITVNMPGFGLLPQPV